VAVPPKTPSPAKSASRHLAFDNSHDDNPVYQALATRPLAGGGTEQPLEDHISGIVNATMAHYGHAQADENPLTQYLVTESAREGGVPDAATRAQLSVLMSAPELVSEPKPKNRKKRKTNAVRTRPSKNKKRK
jgi:hypothetical protein